MEPAEEEEDVLEDVSEVVRRFLQKKKAQREFRNFKECEERANVPIFARMLYNKPVAPEKHSYSAGRVDQVPAVSRNQRVPCTDMQNIPLSQHLKDIVIEDEKRLPFLSPNHQYWQGLDEPERTRRSVPQSSTGTANCGCPKHI
ncbi:uncharacterized protein [Drosophila takahashii]|uniref:uncharacterized protein n=1 Tax=Drosophila takahashii TaxID=29030 RepID=UPI0038993713